MSLTVLANPLLPLLTTNQTHKKLAQNKNSCYFFISWFYVVHLCCFLQYNRQRLPSIFISLPQKTVFPYCHTPIFDPSCHWHVSSNPTFIRHLTWSISGVSVRNSAERYFKIPHVWFRVGPSSLFIFIFILIPSFI